MNSAVNTWLSSNDVLPSCGGSLLDPTNCPNGNKGCEKWHTHQWWFLNKVPASCATGYNEPNGMWLEIYRVIKRQRYTTNMTKSRI